MKSFFNDVCLRQMMLGKPNDVAALMMCGYATFSGKHRIIAAKPQHHYAEHSLITAKAVASLKNAREAVFFNDVCLWQMMLLHNDVYFVNDVAFA